MQFVYETIDGKRTFIADIDGIYRSSDKIITPEIDVGGVAILGDAGSLVLGGDVVIDGNLTTVGSTIFGSSVVFDGGIQTNSIAAIPPAIEIDIADQIVCSGGIKTDSIDVVLSSVVDFPNGLSAIEMIVSPLSFPINVVTIQEFGRSTLNVAGGIRSADSFVAVIDANALHDPLSLVLGASDTNRVALENNKAAGTISLSSYTPNNTLQAWDRNTAASRLYGITVLGPAANSPVAGAGVLQLSSASDAGYGDPIASDIIYSDSDGELKCKNPTGNVVQLSGVAPRANIFALDNAVATVISTSDVFTKIFTPLTVFNQNCLSVIATYAGFQWTSTVTKFLALNYSYSFTVAGAAVDVEFGVIKGGTFNGNQEVTAGTVEDRSKQRVSCVTGSYYVAAGSMMISAALNDIINFVCRNKTDASDLTIVDMQVTVMGQSSGLD